MNFRCECGHRIHDNTDYLSYKGYLISDQDHFDLMDEIDDAIEKSGPSATDKEEAAMRIRSLTNTLFKTIYQCSNCGNLFIDNDHDRTLEKFRGANQVNKNILLSALGDKWRGFLYAEWKNEIPEWQTSHGTLLNETNSSSLTSQLEGNREYNDWESLERDYYKLFHELKNKNVIRHSHLNRNGTVIHSWSFQK